MSLPEWLVLAILSQQPMHGFAVAQLTAAGGELGRVWQIPKAVIYRAIGRLLDADLVVPQSTEQGLGPQRTIYAATPEGSEAARRWLHTPVQHVRDIRSHLLLKLALLDRAGGDPTDLLREPAHGPRAHRRGHRGPACPVRRLRRHLARLAPRDRGRGPGLPRHDHGTVAVGAERP